jgi:hypothetical protein
MSQADRASVARASPHDGAMPRSSFRALARSVLIGHIAFLTLVDLFATFFPCSRTPMALHPRQREHTRHGRGKFGRGIFQPEA